MNAEPLITRSGVRPECGYSEVVRHGNLVWVSGQIGGLKDGSGLADGVDAQTREIFRRLAERLAEVGATLNDVVELVSYHLDMADFPAVAEAKREFFDPEHLPAWTALGIVRLAHPDALLEIKATAVIPHRRL